MDETDVIAHWVMSRWVLTEDARRQARKGLREYRIIDGTATERSILERISRAIDTIR